MKNYLVLWPNGDATVIQCEENQLERELDHEGAAKHHEVIIYELPERFHVGMELVNGKINVNDVQLKGWGKRVNL